MFPSGAGDPAMINLATERLITLLQARDFLPGRSGGPPSVSTLYRWADTGVNGVVLETTKCGGTRCTSLEALQRFCDRLSGTQSSTPQAPPACIPRQVLDALESKGL